MMNSIITYLIEANLCLLIFGLFYTLISKNESNFRFLRGYILIAGFLSLTIPLLEIESPFSLPGDAEVVANNVEYFMAPVLVVTDGNETAEAANNASHFSWFSLLGLIYILGISVFLTLFIYHLVQIIQFRRLKRQNIIKETDYELIPTDGQWPTFAFLNMIFFDNTVPLSTQERQKILDHELIHIKERHSFDILFIECIKIIFWLNPAAWWMKKSLQHIHEFLADQGILRYTDEKEYSSLLARMALKQLSTPIGHHFNKSFTLKRIKMIKTPKSKLKTWKWASTIPVMLIMFIAFSCTDETMLEVEQTLETTSQFAIPEELKPELAKLQKQYPDANFVYLETEVNNEDRVEKLKDVQPDAIGFIKVYKERETVGMLVNKDGPLKNHIQRDGEVFQIVDDPAQPKGGYEELYNEIGKKITYPAQARRAGIEGTVYVQFIIEKDGSLSNVHPVRGIGAGCDSVAVAVIQQVDPWKPAMQNGVPVRQNIVLPIKFHLSDKSGASSKVVLNTPAERRMEIKIEGDDDILFGQIKDSNGKPLAGVNIVLKGETIGTVTNTEGKFKLKIPGGEGHLQFSFIGYETLIMPVKNFK